MVDAPNPGFSASYMALRARGMVDVPNPGFSASYVALRARGSGGVGEKGRHFVSVE